MKVLVEKIDIDRAPLVQKFFESSPEYFRKTDRSEVLPHFAVREMTDAVPAERQSETYQKVFCLLSIDDQPIGIVDLHKDHPKKGQCYLGLLMIDGRHQGKGYGRMVMAAIEEYIWRTLECSEILLGVSEDNDVEGFWRKVGYVRNGKEYIWKGQDHENKVFEMTKTF